MADTITEIEEQIIAQKESYAQLEALNSTSRVSVWRTWVYIVSFVVNVLKELHEVHRKEVDFLIENQRITGEVYFREKALSYRHGHAFDREDLVHTGTYTEDEIEAAKIVKRASVDIVKRDGRNVLFVKLAGENAAGLYRLSPAIVSQVREYMYPLTPAGTNVQYYSGDADELKLSIDVYIDPLIIDENGELIDGSAPAPVPTTINEFLASESFDFNGELRISAMVDEIQQIKGVKNYSVKVKSAYYSTQIPELWETIDEAYTASSGYFRVRPENLTVNYIPRYATE